MRVLIGRMVPTEDNAELATDVYLPGPGKWPVVLIRTSYFRGDSLPFAEQFFKHGIGFVIQDVRGKYDSTGKFEPLVYEAVDGHNTIDWIANQPWSNGDVGLYGVSYLGIVQVPAASGQHEALKCICPSAAPGNFFRDWIRYDGCFAWSNAVFWLLNHATLPNRTTMQHIDKTKLWSGRTVQEVEQYAEMKLPWLAKWCEHDTDDAFWQSLNQDRMHEKIKVPGMHVGGWFDHLTRGQFNAYRSITDNGATSIAREHQRLFIGPWGHMNIFKDAEIQRNYGDWDFGEASNIDVRAEEIRFIKYHLRGEDDGYANIPRAKIFVMGLNRWLDFADWPIPGTQYQQWHLTSNGKANTRHGDGKLAPEEPATKQSDSYTYDPANPVPTIGGNIYWGNAKCGPVDIRETLDRDDVLVYRADPVDKPLTVIGEVELSVTLQTDVEDTDLVAKFGVELPSGEMIVLTVGSLRLKFRDSWTDPTPLTPGNPVTVKLHLSQIGYQFAPGSRPFVSLTSSDFPRILPNTNTLQIFGNPRIARHSVLTGSGALSCLILPVVEGI